MATSVATTFHSAADGEQFTAAAFRLGAASHATVTNGRADALKSRSGVLPGTGTPLDVTQLVTPGMQVTVKKGTVVQQSTSATGGMYSHSLTSDTNLDIGTSNPTNPRLDVVVATVFDDGTSASNTKIEVLQGTAGASPALPSALSSPPANTHYFPLAQVRVEAAVTSIVTAKITKPVVSGLSLTMGQFTCAPGGTLQGVTRLWQGTRSTVDAVAVGGAAGNVLSATLTAAECLPGVYMATFFAFGAVAGTQGTGYSDFDLTVTTPAGSRVCPITWPNGCRWHFTASEPFFLEVVPGSNQSVTLNAQAYVGQAINLGNATNVSIVKVTRVSDY